MKKIFLVYTVEKNLGSLLEEKKFFGGLLEKKYFSEALLGKKKFLSKSSSLLPQIINGRPLRARS